MPEVLREGARTYAPTPTIMEAINPGAYLLRHRDAIASTGNDFPGGRVASIDEVVRVAVVADGEDNGAGVYDDHIVSRKLMA